MRFLKSLNKGLTIVRPLCWSYLHSSPCGCAQSVLVCSTARFNIKDEFCDITVSKHFRPDLLTVSLQDSGWWTIWIKTCKCHKTLGIYFIMLFAA